MEIDQASSPFVARLLSINGSPLPKPVQGTIDHINQDGIGLLLNGPLESGDRMGVSFTFPGDEAPTEVEVEVAYARRRETRDFVSNCSFVSSAPKVSRLANDRIAALAAP